MDVFVWSFEGVDAPAVSRKDNVSLQPAQAMELVKIGRHEGTSVTAESQPAFSCVADDGHPLTVADSFVVLEGESARFVKGHNDWVGRRQGKVERVIVIVPIDLWC